MTKDLKRTSPAADFAELKELFGPPPILSTEDAKAYYAMMARILDSLGASDFIEQMLAKDLTDATWEMKRCARHKALAIERKYRGQQELEEAEEQEAGQPAEPAQESEQTGEPEKEGQQIEQAEQGQTGAPTTQFERMLELAEVVDTVMADCDAIIAGPVGELECAAAFQSAINYYERLDRLYTVLRARREDVLKELDLYRNGLGRHLRRLSDDIIDGEFSEANPKAPSIIAPDDGTP